MSQPLTGANLILNDYRDAILAIHKMNYGEMLKVFPDFGGSTYGISTFDIMEKYSPTEIIKRVREYIDSLNYPKHNQIWENKDCHSRVVIEKAENGFVNYTILTYIEKHLATNVSIPLDEFIKYYKNTGEVSKHMDGLIKELESNE